MANIRSSAKRARQTERRSLENKRVISGVKTQLRKTRQAIDGGNLKAARAEAQTLSSVLDRASKTGQLHQNAVNRHKSEANRKLAALKA